jgi:citrate synthase
MIREGIEDYEMLYLLRELVQQKGDKLSEADRKSAAELLSVPESITKSMTEFTIDPRPVLQRRIAVAKLIERLTDLQ